MRRYSVLRQGPTRSREKVHKLFQVVDAKLHVGRRLPEDLPVHLSARSDEGGEQSSRYARYPDASHMRAECMRARAEQRPLHNLHRRYKSELDAGGLQVYVCEVKVELLIPVHGVIVLYDM